MMLAVMFPSSDGSVDVQNRRKINIIVKEANA